MRIKGIIDKYRKIPVQAKATLWFMVCTMLQRSISVLTTPIFTRLMSEEQYGQYTVYLSWVQIFTIITTLRLNWSVFSKGMHKYKEDRDGYTSTMQTITFVLTLIITGIYLIFHKAINVLTELPTLIMLAMFAELAVFPAVEFWTVRKRFEYIYKPVVFRTLLMALLNAAVGVAAVLLFKEKGYARILSVIAVNFCFGIILFIYNLRKGKILFKKEYAVFAITFNLPLLLHYLSVFIMDQFDRIMIQKMVDLRAAALYGVAYSAGMLMKIVTQSLNNAMVPWQYEKLDKKEFKSLDKTMFIIFGLVGGCAVLASAFAPELMMLLADAKYHEAVYVIPPVALGMVFSFMYTTFANVEFFFNSNKFTMYISIAGAALNIILNYIGIRLFGYIAAAYTTLICYLLFSAAHFVYMSYCMKKQENIKHPFAAKRLIILSALLIAASCSMNFLYESFIVRYTIILIGLAAAVIFRKRIMTTLKTVKLAKKKK